MLGEAAAFLYSSLKCWLSQHWHTSLQPHPPSPQAPYTDKSKLWRWASSSLGSPPASWADAELFFTNAGNFRTHCSPSAKSLVEHSQARTVLGVAGEGWGHSPLHLGPYSLTKQRNSVSKHPAAQAQISLMLMITQLVKTRMLLGPKSIRMPRQVKAFIQCELLATAWFHWNFLYHCLILDVTPFVEKQMKPIEIKITAHIHNLDSKSNTHLWF